MKKIYLSLILFFSPLAWAHEYADHDLKCGLVKISLNENALDFHLYYLIKELPFLAESKKDAKDLLEKSTDIFRDKIQIVHASRGILNPKLISFEVKGEYVFLNWLFPLKKGEDFVFSYIVPPMVHGRDQLAIVYKEEGREGEKSLFFYDYYKSLEIKNGNVQIKKLTPAELVKKGFGFRYIIGASLIVLMMNVFIIRKRLC